jgi:hypothetical protein
MNLALCGRGLSTRVGILRLLFVPTSLFWFNATAQPQPGLQASPYRLRPEVSDGQAALVGSLPPKGRMNLSFVLPLRNERELSGLLNRLYDPASSDYRHFLSVAEFTERFGPTAGDYQAVIDFARAHGLTVTGRPANRRLVPVSASVARINEILHVKMNLYRHPTEGRNFYSPDRTPALDLKIPLAEIAGLDNFVIPRRMARRQRETQASPNYTGSGPSGYFLPSDLRAAYYGSGPLTGSGQVFGVFLLDGYAIADTVSSFNGAASSTAFGNDYLLTYTPTAGGPTYNIPVIGVLLDGDIGNPSGIFCSSTQCDDADESNDMVEMIGMAPGISQVRQYIGQWSEDVFNAIASENLAKQINCSYDTYTSSTDASLFQELAAQGQNIFVSSGDEGAYPLDPGDYWSSNPWITAVGANQLFTNGAGGTWSSEIAWPASGGGIAAPNDLIPSWQIGVANTSNGGSTTLRNSPDVSAEGTSSYACSFGVCGGWGGTSFSAPRWAGFMALVNQQAAAASGSTVGFMNPALYQIGKGSNYNGDFHDIVSGNNSDNGTVTPYYNAVPGYDLVTGWGSPNGQSLIDDLVALQPAPPAGFLLSASPASLTIAPDASAATTIAIRNVGGFSGGVSLTVSGLPSGVTASFGQSTATGTSALTLTVGSQVSRGIYTVMVTGTSGALTQNCVLALAVDAPGFSIAASPATINLSGGGSAMATITVTSYGGFTGSVALAASASLPYLFQGNAVLPTVSFGTTSPVSLTANGTGTATLYISATPASTQASLARPAHSWLPAASAALACLLFFAIPARRRSQRLALGMLLLLVALAGGFCGCGGGGGGAGPTPTPTPSPTPTPTPTPVPGVFLINVTGASGTITQGCSLVVYAQ